MVAIAPLLEFGQVVVSTLKTLVIEAFRGSGATSKLTCNQAHGNPCLGCQNGRSGHACDVQERSTYFLKRAMRSGRGLQPDRLLKNFFAMIKQILTRIHQRKSRSHSPRPPNMFSDRQPASVLCTRPAGLTTRRRPVPSRSCPFQNASIATRLHPDLC